MKKDKSKYKVVDIDVLEQINEDAAGIDIGVSDIYVAVPKGRDEESVRRFGTFTCDLNTIADWLASCNIKTVAMEATGIYWLPLYEILESKGFEVYLVNAAHTKNVTGRKSDVVDCQWVQQLHTYGLLQASFRPPEQICALRALVRQRELLIRYRSAHIQHMQKALHQMNIQLTNVLSDITGVTGMQIIRAIIAGEHDPTVLAAYRNNQCAKSEAEIAKSLEGHYKREHLFILRQAVELYDFYDQQLQATDAELDQLYREFEPANPPATDPPPQKQSKRRKNQPYFDLAQSLYAMTGVDLTQVDGLDALTVQTILSETGVDMSPWPTDKHFTSWLGLSPNNKVTGGKVKQRGTKKVQNRAATAFRIAAQSLARSDSALGGFYRRMRAKHGAPKAIVATAHKLARIVYFMLKRREPYRDPGADYYEQQYRERAIRNLQRKAAKFGLRLEPALVT
jgi:transposase